MTMTVLGILGFLALGAYLIGALPFSYWIARAAKGIDLRQEGSRNVGATNVMRTCGKSWGLLAYALDMLKGVALVWGLHGFWKVAAWQVPLLGGYEGWLLLIFGIGIIGHVYSVYLFFRGGKGVATAAGIFLCVAPVPLVAAGAVFGLALLGTGYVALGSILGAIALPVGLWMQMQWDLPWMMGYETYWQQMHANLLLGIALGVMTLVLVKHRSNVIRLIQGREYAFKGLGRASKGSREP